MTYEEEIRLQSYLIWQQESSFFGSELDHWQRAKALIEAKREAVFQKACLFR
jgi:hypothetical protein